VKKSYFIVSLALCSLLPACGPAPSSAIHLTPQTLPLSSGQAVFIDTESGSVDITSGAGGAVEIAGQVPSADTGTFAVSRDSGGIYIIAKEKGGFLQPRSSPALQLKVRVPNGTSVHADTYDAGIDVHDFTGQADISSTGGDVRVQNSTGKFNVKANRGNVAIGASSGEIQVAGNYGLISLEDASGAMGVSTILGTVNFTGGVRAGDTLNLETDHGPVAVQLAPDTDASVLVATTSGAVTCLVPGIQPAGSGCAGTLQDGRGHLKIRTVSGSIMLQSQP
jgi:hypothetical protein